MKKYLQIFANFKLEEKFLNLKNTANDFIKKHPEIFCLSLLAIACILFLFLGLGYYPLMDVDETRYAVMSRDLFNSGNWNILTLNGVPFLEKPPLYFWLVGYSLKFFGSFSSFAIRFPVALLSAFIIFFTYYLGKRVISRKFGVTSALILLTSAFFLILSHIAVLDMVLNVFMTSAIYCAFLTHFCQEKNKKYYWWFFYLFIGLGFLAKGILALAIPFAVILIYNFFTKTVKDIFKPIHILPGAAFFLLLVLPWHLIMYKTFGFQFVKEYFLVHHFSRFINSENIGRERPFLYFAPVFLLGFLPWVFTFIDFVIDGTKKIVSKFKALGGTLSQRIMGLFEVTNNEQKLVLFCLVYFSVVFLVFSSSSTKLPTYILPIFPAASLLAGYYWWTADEREEHQRSIYNSTLILAALFILLALSASLVYYFLPFDLQFIIKGFKNVIIITFYALSILLILRLNAKRALSVFAGYIITMFFVVMFAVTQIFNLVYSTGQNEIVNYSLISVRPNYNSQLVTFDFAVKPSVLIPYNDNVNFLTDADFEQLDKLLQYKGGPTFVIIKNKNIKKDKNYLKELDKRLKLIETGKKYSLYVKDVNGEYKSKAPKKGLLIKFR